MTDFPEPTHSNPESGEIGRAVFATTHWSVVLAASGGDTSRSHQALSRLCHSYWYPLYAYLRRRGYNPQDAEDLTQEFFARLLRRDSFSRVTREGGRFRSFLLKSLNRFLTDQWRRARSQKRDAGQVISIDTARAESRYSIEPVEAQTPEKAYDRAWALTLLASTFQSLRGEYTQSGKASLFETLKFCLTGERSSVPYADLGRQLNLPENTVKTLVHRLRRRYRELLRAEVAKTVVRPDDIDEELRSLFRALA
jgi:RNA polymerase sigma-70 factor (ECF subfamily)